MPSQSSNLQGELKVCEELERERRYLWEEVHVAQLHDRLRDTEAALGRRCSGKYTGGDAATGFEASELPAGLEALMEACKEFRDSYRQREAAECWASWACSAHNRLRAVTQVLGAQLKQLCAASSAARSNGILEAASALQEALKMLEAEQGVFEDSLESHVLHAKKDFPPWNHSSSSSTDDGSSETQTHCSIDSSSSWGSWEKIASEAELVPGEQRRHPARVGMLHGAVHGDWHGGTERSGSALSSISNKHSTSPVCCSRLEHRTKPKRSSVPEDSCEPRGQALHVPTPLRRHVVKDEPCVPPEKRLTNRSRNQYQGKISRMLNALPVPM
eukprot:gnl/MRDRNA2_/MRDRNA2_103662_c0_seq1.p1 gnl/MRDRNA2_/MRDRNA2_103662_c0~~gnl/MRDRNA2_/MRDRNA2_103662_c0_seq1.p1  ORF type:complete len:330 (+),score=75.45 gnl/MRDRNA2_/MRDRNA2_103662_c0_seq1:64-1053(+)